MECYRVQIPDGVKVAGATATGERTTLLPGEYLAHRLRPRNPAAAATLLRFVAADALGRDVHVPLASVRKYLEQGARVLPGEVPGEQA